MVAYRSSTITTYDSRTNTVATAPAGIADGDALFLFVIVGATTPPNVTPPAGFSLLPNFPTTVTETGGFSVRCSAFVKIASSESGSYTVTHTAASSQAYMAAYSQPNALTPFSPNPTVNSGTGTTTTMLGLTTATDDSVVITISQDWGNTTNNLTPPSGTAPTFTERADAPILEIADGVLATAGATGNKTIGNNSGLSTLPWQGFMFAMPAAGTLLLSAPTNLHTTGATATSVSLAWDAVTGAAGYETSAAVAFTLGEFSIYGSQIIDPAGQPYIPVGGNVNGPDCWWTDPTIGSSSIAQMWHWNTVRLSSCWVGGCPSAGGWDWHTNDDLAGIISEYTAKHIVVMIALHQFTGTDSLSSTDSAALVTWWTGIAQQFKDNTYVWFNVINEPVTGGQASFASWTAMTEPSVQAIRATGARNIVVVDGSAWGQEADDWNLGDAPYQNSAILALCPAMQATYGNILGSVHVYGEWGGGSTRGTTQQLNDRLSHYIDQVHAANLPLIIGETGDQPDPLADTWAGAGQWYGTDTAFNVAPGKGVGLLWWHASAGSGFQLCTGSSGTGWEGIDSATNPTALSYFGQRLFNYGIAVNP